MIDKEAFYKKHADFPRESMFNMLEICKIEFPKKVLSLKQHMETLNYGEAMYFADFIDDSYAFIFCDYELRSTLQEIYRLAKTRNTEGLQNIFPTLEEQTLLFEKDLNSIKI